MCKGGGRQRGTRTSGQVTGYAHQRITRRPRLKRGRRQSRSHLRLASDLHTRTVAHSHPHPHPHPQTNKSSPTIQNTSFSVSWLLLLIIMIYQVIPQFPICTKRESYLFIKFSVKTGPNFHMIHMVTFLIVQQHR